MSAFIPASPRDLTPEWVTGQLRAAGALPAGRVVGLEVRPLTGGGTGFTGETVRIELVYEGVDDAPRSVIAKFPTDDRQTRGMLEQFDAYAREIRFYRQFAHRMPCPLPTYLGAAFDERGGRRSGRLRSRMVDALPDRVQLAITSDVTKFMRATDRRYALLIEDLGSDSAVYDLTAPPNRGQLADALGVLASVHAAFWDDASIEGSEVFRPILTTTPGLYQTIGRKRCLPMARARWEKWLSVEHVAILHDALDRFPRDVAILNEQITLIHGDPRSDNILYRADGQVVLVDWALVGHAHPAFDIGYLLSSSVVVDQAEQRAGLVEHYAHELAGHGVELEGRGIDLQAAVDAAYRALAVQQLMGIAVLHNESYGSDAMSDLWMPRILAGIEAGW